MGAVAGAHLPTTASRCRHGRGPAQAYLPTWAKQHISLAQTYLQEADFFTAVPRVLAEQIRTRMSAPGKFESLLKASSGLSSLHPQVPSKTQKVRSYFQPVTGAGRTATCGT